MGSMVPSGRGAVVAPRCRLADQTRAYMDMLAERAVSLGGTANGTIQAAAEISNLPAFPLAERSQWRLVEELVQRLGHVAADLPQALISMVASHRLPSRNHGARSGRAGSIGNRSVTPV